MIAPDMINDRRDGDHRLLASRRRIPHPR